MSAIEITVLEGDAKELDDRLEHLLDAHSMEAGHPFIYDDVNIEATEGNKLVGGLMAKAQLGWLFVKLLALAPEARGKGVGSGLVKRAEEIAREMGLEGVYLDTYAFQAPGFYEKQGYTEMGRLPAGGGYPQRIWFYKQFAKEGSPS